MSALLVSVFVASVAGSLHCVGMCGPFAALACARSDRVRLPIVRAAPAVGAYNGGRLLTYTLLGAAAGGVGMLVDRSGSLLGLSRAATALAGGTMLALGVLGLLRAAGIAPGRGALAPATTGRLSRIFARVTRLSPRRRAFVLGTLTTLMPCGWLWAFVLAAAGTGAPLAGAAVMLAFWAGTVPALALLGVGVHALSGRVRRAVPWVMPTLVAAVGVYTLVVRAPLPVALPDATSNTAVEPASCH